MRLDFLSGPVMFLCYILQSMILFVIYYRISIATVFGISAFDKIWVFFPWVVDYEKVTERAYIMTYGGRVKRSCHLYSVIGIQSRSEDPPSGDQLHLQTTSFTEVVSQTLINYKIIYGGYSGQSYR